MLSFGFISYLVQLFWGMSESPLSILQHAHSIWFLGDLVIYTLVVLAVWLPCNQKFTHDWKYLLAGVFLTCIPQVGYGFRGPFFYLYYIAGYCLAVYLTGFQIIFFSKYSKVGIVAFLLTYIVYSNLPWPFEHFQANWHNFSFIHIGTVISLKVFLGFLGSYVALVLIHQMLPRIHDTWLFRQAKQMGAYTLDIYLIQMIFIERILGPLYRRWISVPGVDYMHIYGLLFEIVVTFVLSFVLLEFISCVSRLFNQSPLFAFVLFYRKIKA